MALRNTQLEFGAAAKWLHWLAAPGILALSILGLLQSDMDSGPQLVAVQVLAALYHQFMLKNNVLERMAVGVAAENRDNG